MTVPRVVTVLASLAALAAAAATAVDLLQGADLSWTVAANLLLLPVAAALAGWAWGTTVRPVAVLVALGILVGPVGALLGDRAGSTWWWLALEATWWVGVALVAWRSRPGLAVITALAAVSGLLAAAFRVLAIPEPLASGAGVRVVMTVAWAMWVGLDLALRSLPGSLPRAR